MEGLLFPFSVMCLLILLLIFLLKKLNQPYPVAYILAGFLLGPGATGIFTGPGTISALGEIGVLLLMFFLGMEIEIPDQRSLLLQPVIGQGVRTGLCLICALLTGAALHWPPGNMLVMTIVLLFNSTAIVSEFLRKTGELQTAIGKMVLNILLLQDIMLAPSFTLFHFMDHRELDTPKLVASIAGCVLLFLLLRSIRNKSLFQLPFWKEMERDHDLQVFTGACICLGFALLAAEVGLSAPIGSFAAGIYIGRTVAFHWLGDVLKPFKVFFVALFFISLGLMLDSTYIYDHWVIILTMVLAVMLINSVLSAFVFRLLGYSVPDSLYGGALLSQTGELGLLACAITYKAQIIDETFFNLALAVTGLTFLFSSVWMTVMRKLINSRKTNDRINKKMISI
jgi:CPA2 family monovalent cation:H+ antiporter-2